MAAGSDREAPESQGPDTDEERDHENCNGPRRSVLTRPQVCPIPAVGSGEEEVLNENRDEKPENHFAADGGAVEGRDAARGLAVVVRQAEEEE